MAPDERIDVRISGWLEAEAPGRLPDRVLQATFERTRKTRQRGGAWRALLGRLDMTRLTFAIGAAVALVVAIGGFALYSSSSSGTGSQPSPSPSATPRPARVDGPLQPGTYVAQLQRVPDLAVTFTVPSGWTAYGDNALLGLLPTGTPGTEAPGGIAIQFRDVTTLKGDPCNWSGPDDDIPVGPTVDDLVQALQEQTAYEASDPVDVTIGGYPGQRVDIVSPTELYVDVDGQPTAVGCDDGVWRPWDGEIYAQGPANRWQTNILDVDGTRLVIVAQDFPGTTASDRAELDAIVDSFDIGS